MSLRVTFELADSDLKHFKSIMREAREAATGKSQSEILDASRALLDSVGEIEVPEFISDRLNRIQNMIEMVEDPEWKLPPAESQRIVNALSYFSEPEDLIPDHVPGLGFLDDAIMVELVVRELRHDIDGYADFCRFRAVEEKRRAKSGQEEDAPTRESWLTTRRQELHSRIKDRRRTERERRRGRRGGPADELADQEECQW